MKNQKESMTRSTWFVRTSSYRFSSPGVAPKGKYQVLFKSFADLDATGSAVNEFIDQMFPRSQDGAETVVENRADLELLRSEIKELRRCIDLWERVRSNDVEAL